MDKQEIKEVQAVVREVLVESLRFRASHLLQLWGPEGEDPARELRAEAARLTTPPAAPEPDRFAGVKYVVLSGIAEPHRLVGPRAWRAKHGREPSPNSVLFTEAPNGVLHSYDHEQWYTPWTPEVGEKVRHETSPHLVATVDSIHPARDYPYHLHWEKGGSADILLRALRPFSFAPPEPEPAPEPPEFPNGTLVADKEGEIRVALDGDRIGMLNGDPSEAKRGGDWHRATVAEIAPYIKEYPYMAADGLLARAQQIAGEAKT